MPFAAGLSTHPVTAHAVGEAIGQILDVLGSGVDLACLFVSRGHAGALEDAAAAVRRTLTPGVLIGCAAEAVIGCGLEVEDAAAISLWAGMFGSVAGVRLAPGGRAGRPGLASPRAAVMLADPFSYPPGDLPELLDAAPGVALVGGMASGAHGPGGSRLVLDDRVFTDGAVGVLIGPDRPVGTVVSQGCRPVGRALVVTRAERNVVYELAGQPALDRLTQMARETMSDEDVRLVNRGLQLGLVIDEHQADFGPGDFLVRGVVGADRSNGAIAIDDVVEVGSTVQFHVRDATSADTDLHLLLDGRRADGVLAFCCTGRGRRLFGEPNHDASVIAEELDDPATAGFFAAGEFGPLGGRNYLHTYTSSLLLLEDPEPRPGALRTWPGRPVTPGR